MCRTPEHRTDRRVSTAIRRSAVCMIMLLGVAACGEDDETDAAAGVAASQATTEHVTTSAIASTTTTTAVEEPTTTTATPSSTETSIAECTEEPCPIPAEDRQWIDEFVTIYNGGTWEEFTAHVGSDQPTWGSPLGPIEPEWIRGDFRWSRALNEKWEIEDCTESDGIYVCTILIEDDLHRGMGLEPSSCRFHFSSTDGIVQPSEYEIVPCHEGYDAAMHAFGSWFERTYPDLEPIQGFHYRAWNQLSETAPSLAGQYLGEFLTTQAGA